MRNISWEIKGIYYVSELKGPGRHVLKQLLVESISTFIASFSTSCVLHSHAHFPRL